MSTSTSTKANLQEAKGKEAVKFREYMQILKSNKTPMFFEGEDAKYYSCRIEMLYGSSWEGINCGGRVNVLSLRERINNNENYDKNRKGLFFVDADFENNDILEQCDNVYVTPCYSIENLYLSDETFDRILRDECNISACQHPLEDHINIVSLFKERKKEFLDIIEDFNFLIYILKTSGHCLNINNVALKTLVSINLNAIYKKYDVTKPHTIFTELSESVCVSLDTKTKVFLNKKKELYFRGKQNIQFLSKFLRLLREDLSKELGSPDKQTKIYYKVKLQLGNNVVSELSQYAETPDCLKQFLKTHAKQHGVIE